MRVLFIGTGDIGLPALRWLIDTPKHELVGVVTQPDKPAGRKLALLPPSTKVAAEAAGVAVLQPAKIRQSVAELAALRPDIAVVVAYGQLLPRSVLDVPRLGCINIHASLLPRYRGASPIQAAIREGDAESGVTIMFMDEGLDTGDIVLEQRCPLSTEETGGSLHDKLAELAPAALEQALDLIASGAAPRTPQNHSLATHVSKLSREQGHIDWNKSAIEIERSIRAYNPWPGTYCLLPDHGGKLPALKIHRARVVTGEACPSGGIVVGADPRRGFIVSCGSGMLELLEVQAEGGRRLPAADFLRGHEIPVGSRLS